MKNCIISLLLPLTPPTAFRTVVRCSSSAAQVPVSGPPAAVGLSSQLLLAAAFPPPPILRHQPCVRSVTSAATAHPPNFSSFAHALLPIIPRNLPPCRHARLPPIHQPPLRRPPGQNQTSNPSHFTRNINHQSYPQVVYEEVLRSLGAELSHVCLNASKMRALCVKGFFELCVTMVLHAV